MWKFVFFLNVMLTLELSASTCSIDNIEDAIAKLMESPHEKNYSNANERLFNLRYKQETILKMPEFSFGYEIDKNEVKKNELTAELLFNLDDYLKYNTLKKVKKSELELDKLEIKQEATERAESSLLSLFKISQNTFFLGKINILLDTLKSSELIYTSKPIRSRENLIIINSLVLLRSNLFLKKNRLLNANAEELINLRRLGNDKCIVDYKDFIKNIDNYNITFTNHGILRSEMSLGFQLENSMNSSELMRRRSFNNLKFGPTITREQSAEDVGIRIGVLVSFDIPSVGQSSFDYIDQAKKVALIKKDRAKKDNDSNIENLKQKFREYSDSLKQLPSFESLETNLKTAKKSFDSGVISPLVYIEAYRSYVDFLEISEDMRKNIFESYLKLRGMYENNPN